MIRKIKNDNILDKETVALIKKQLQDEKERVFTEIKSISGNGESETKQTIKFPDFGNKNDENAQEIDQYSTNIATEKVLESTLRDIENALKRIEKGTYGVCKYCGKNIGKKRMQARPVASACVECKTKLQKG